MPDAELFEKMAEINKSIAPAIRPWPTGPMVGTEPHRIDFWGFAQFRDVNRPLRHGGSALRSPHSREGLGLPRVAVPGVSELRPIEPVTNHFCVGLVEAEFRRRMHGGDQPPEELRIQHRRLIPLEVAKEDSSIGWGHGEDPTARSRPHTSPYANGDARCKRRAWVGLLRQDDASARQNDHLDVPRHVEALGGEDRLEAAFRMPCEGRLLEVGGGDSEGIKRPTRHREGRHGDTRVQLQLWMATPPTLTARTSRTTTSHGEAHSEIIGATLHPARLVGGPCGPRCGTRDDS